MRTLPLSALNASANLLLSGSALTPVIMLRLRITLIIEFQTGKRPAVLHSELWHVLVDHDIHTAIATASSGVTCSSASVAA